jgi:hypothetical protein
MIYRNRRLLDLAKRLNWCLFRLPGCIGYSSHGNEPIHSDSQKHGKGTGIKSADDQHVAGCHQCHLYYGSEKVPKAEKLEVFEPARERTFELYARNGWLEEVGYEEAEA